MNLEGRARGGTKTKPNLTMENKMAKNQNVPTVVIPDDSALVSEVLEYSPLPKGDYEVTVEDIESSQVKNGVHAGKPVLNIKLKTETNRVLYKQIPMWAASENTSERTWIRMARVAFVVGAQITNEILFTQHQNLIGTTITAVVDAKVNEGHGLQNFVVTFK